MEEVKPATPPRSWTTTFSSRRRQTTNAEGPRPSASLHHFPGQRQCRTCIGTSRAAALRTCATAALMSMRSIRRRSRCASPIAIDDDDLQLWLPTDPVPPVFADIAAEPSAWKLVAHHYGFDFERHRAENVLVARYRLSPSFRTRCSIARCASRWRMLIPAELDLLAQALGSAVPKRSRRRAKPCSRFAPEARIARPPPSRCGTKIRRNCS